MDGERRPRFTPAQKWVFALGALVAILGLLNLGRVVVALRMARILPDLPMTVSYSYLAATGGVWGVTLLVSAVGLLRFYRWARWTTLAATTLYAIHTWVNRFLFDASDYARRTRPQDLVLTILFLILNWVMLNLPAIRRTFASRDRSPLSE